MGATGRAVIDFGAAPGSDHATVAVTGQASITGTSFVEAWLDPTAAATADHTQDEHVMAAGMLGLSCSLLVAGTGFTIHAVAVNYGLMFGAFNVCWVWN